MTANRNSHTRSDNSGVTPRVPDDPDAQALVDYLRSVGSATVDGLAATAGLPRAHLKDLLDDLQREGFVDVETGFHSTRVTLVEADADKELVTDGGPIRTIADAITGDTLADSTPSVDLTPDQVWTVLSSRRRRRFIRLLAVLHDSDREYYLELTNVAAALVTTTAGMRSSDVRHGDQHRIYVSLCQTHAPLLENLGLVSYYERVRKVQATDDVVHLARMMDWVTRACERSPVMKRWKATDSRRATRDRRVAQRGVP